MVTASIVLNWVVPYSLDSYIYCILAEVPGVAREKKLMKKKLEKIRFFAYNTPRPSMSVYKKFQPNRSSRLAGYTQHIYMNVLLYYIDKKIFRDKQNLE